MIHLVVLACPSCSRLTNSNRYFLIYILLVQQITITHCSIYLTRQFDIVDGTLVDKSTGEQLTTKTHGNLIGATLFGEVDGSGRLLTNTNDMCYGTVNMTLDTQSSTYTNYLAGESIRYTTMVNNHVTNGVVKFISAPEPIDMSVSDVEALEFEFNWLGFGEYMEANVHTNQEFETKLNETEIDTRDIVFYFSIVCGECDSTGAHEEFFMWCIGTIDQALLGTGNCCLVSYAQLDEQQDVRRLGKCTSAKRRRGGV